MTLRRSGDFAEHAPRHEVLCAAKLCDAKPVEDAPAPLCERHLRLAFVYVLEHDQPDIADRELPYWSRDAAPTGWVYFIRVGDLVKIGYTRKPPQRFAALQPSEVLHMEPGTMQDEKRCHYLFDHLRAEGREYFRPEPDLLRFIGDLQKRAA